MDTVTVRELRQSWPAVEKRLAAAGELVVTRDGAPVAELRRTPGKRPAASGRRFDAEAHMKKLGKFWGKRRPPFTSEQLIAAGRVERNVAADR